MTAGPPVLADAAASPAHGRHRPATARTATTSSDNLGHAVARSPGDRRHGHADRDRGRHLFDGRAVRARCGSGDHGHEQRRHRSRRHPRGRRCGLYRRVARDRESVEFDDRRGRRLRDLRLGHGCRRTRRVVGRRARDRRQHSAHRCRDSADHRRFRERHDRAGSDGRRSQRHRARGLDLDSGGRGTRAARREPPRSTPPLLSTAPWRSPRPSPTLRATRSRRRRSTSPSTTRFRISRRSSRRLPRSRARRRWSGRLRTTRSGSTTTSSPAPRTEPPSRPCRR